MEEKGFYRAFEEKHRGSRDLIKSRLEVYLSFVLPFKEIYGENCNAIDLGCGRGEWLELMQDNGINACGVDLDEGMLEACYQLNLSVQQKDALTALKELADDSQIIVSGFHIAEHLPFDVLQKIVKESLRVLKPAGLLILETPNPENLRVATDAFYLDPSHKTPLPPELLSFIPEYYSFKRTKILRLQEPPELRILSAPISLLDVYQHVSPDYSIIAQKDAASEMLNVFRNEFSRDYGIKTDVLLKRYETGINTKISSVEAKVQSAEVKAQSAEAKAREVAIIANELKTSLNAVYASRSWRMTAPYRELGDLARHLSHKVKLCLKPICAVLAMFVVRHKWLKITIISIMNHFPKFKERIEVFYFGYVTPNENDVQNDVLDSDDNGNFIEKMPMTPYALEIYKELKKEIERSKTEEN